MSLTQMLKGLQDRAQGLTEASVCVVEDGELVLPIDMLVRYTAERVLLGMTKWPCGWVVVRQCYYLSLYQFI